MLQLRWLWQDRAPSPLAKLTRKLIKQGMDEALTGTMSMRGPVELDTTTSGAEDILRSMFLRVHVAAYETQRQSKDLRSIQLFTLGREINRRIRKIADRWKSANPMSSEKMQALLEKHKIANLYDSKFITLIGRRIATKSEEEITAPEAFLGMTDRLRALNTELRNAKANLEYHSKELEREKRNTFGSFLSAMAGLGLEEVKEAKKDRVSLLSSLNANYSYAEREIARINRSIVSVQSLYDNDWH